LDATNGTLQCPGKVVENQSVALNLQCGYYFSYEMEEVLTATVFGVIIFTQKE
jgi:hypothetical protein